MATFQASTLFNSSSASAALSRRKMINAALNFPKIHKTNLSLPILRTKRFMEDLDFKSGYTTITSDRPVEKKPDSLVVAKLYAIMEAVADRVEMHNNICEQRNNWNSLLLTSVNGIILAAATMAGIAAAAAGPGLALKLSSTLLYLSATGMLAVMNKIQPSQLAEEQRNAARLFKNLHNQIQTTLSAGNATAGDVTEAMNRVLALDKAYPLPLLGAMLEKFPAAVAPAVWWPEQPRRQPTQIGGNNNNDWNGELEEDMRELIKVMKIKDREDYLRLGNRALKLNKILAISGPILTSLAAIGSSLAGPTTSWAAIVGVAAGALAAVVNTLQHGGQVGMVFEMYRSNAGFFKMVEDSIDSNLEEKDLERRENAQVFEMKVALMLGRSVSELKDVAAKSRSLQKEEIDEFASKLF